MNVENCDSGTEVSSDSSWTVIEETEEHTSPNTDSASKPNENIDIQVIRKTEIVTISDVQNDKDDDFIKVSFSNSSVKQSSDEESTSSKNETKENGFLTFDEYLQERMLEHDYEYPSESIFKKKLNKSKKSTKSRAKCKAETVGVLSLCASLLTVTGIALLCITFPENIDAKNFDTIKSNCQAIGNNDSLDYNNILASLNKTKEVLNAANSSGLLSKCSDTLQKTPEYKYKSYRRFIGPMDEIGSSRSRSLRKRRNGISSTNLFKNMCYPKNTNDVCYINEDPRLNSNISNKRLRNKSIETKKLNHESNATINPPSNSTDRNKQTTALSTIETVLAGTSLKKIIRSIIHDICILKLITYFNKKPSRVEKNKSSKGEQKASKRKLFEAIADGLERIHYDENKERKIKTALRKCKTKKHTHKQNEKSNVNANALNIKSQSKYDNPDQNSIVQCSRQCIANLPKRTELLSKFENGKSECERRFDELDTHRKKSSEVCSKHKINIQQIKQQYRNEMDAIKDSNIEPIVRLYRIQSLREKYKLQLKRNREVYMREMSKMKRLRTKMLKELCSQKKIDLEMRDASVGSYVVPIKQDFFSRLKQMKDQEVTPNTFNGFSFQECTRNGNSEPSFHLPRSTTFYFPSTKSMDGNMKTGNIFQSSDINQNERNYPKLSSIQSKSNSVKLSNTEVKNICSIENKDTNIPKEESMAMEDMGVCYAKGTKQIQDHLYQMVFEKNGPMIEKFDNMKWNQKKNERWDKYKRDLYKHGRQKCFKPNIENYRY